MFQNMDWQPMVALMILFVLIVLIAIMAINMSFSQRRLARQMRESEAGTQRIAAHRAAQEAAGIDYRGGLPGQGTSGMPNELMTEAERQARRLGHE